jgi:hypothetical protein
VAETQHLVAIGIDATILILIAILILSANRVAETQHLVAIPTDCHYIGCSTLPKILSSLGTEEGERLQPAPLQTASR